MPNYIATIRIKVSNATSDKAAIEHLHSTFGECDGWEVVSCEDEKGKDVAPLPEPPPAPEIVAAGEAQLALMKAAQEGRV